jgi:DME family drug/metabolite transporter
VPVDTRLAVVGLSLLGAFLLACTSVLVKLGLKHSDVRQSVLVAFGANALVIALAVLVLRPQAAMSERGVLLFMADGLLGLLAVSLLFVGIDRVGPTISLPIKNASPILALLFASLALGEAASPAVYAGALLAVAGVLVLSAQRGRKGLRWQPAVLFPVAGAVFFAADNVMRKAALRELPSPLVGVAIAVATSFALALVTDRLLPAAGKGRLFDAGTPYYALAGLAQAGALLAVYSALEFGMVSVVVPIYTSSPLFVLPLSALFLREVEQVTVRKVIGAVAVVLGVLLVSLY